MAWLLGVFERIHHGAALFTLLEVLLFFGALLAFALLSPRPRPVVALVLGLIFASPLALIYQGIVWKDVLFADASVGAFAALAWAGRLWSGRYVRAALLLLALILFTLAGLTRQSGLVVPLVGALALGVVAARARAGARANREGAAWGLSGALLLALGTALSTLYLYSHGDGRPENRNQVKRLEVYDLAGALHFDPALPLPVLAARDPGLEAYLRRQAGPHFTAEGADNLENVPGGDRYLVPAGDAVTAQWTAFVERRPGLWLRVRATAFLATFLTPKALDCPMVVIGVDGDDPALLRNAGLSARYTPKDAWDEGYANAFVGTPVFSHLTYGALALVLLGLALRDIVRGDRRPELVVVVALLSAGLLFAATFLPITYACDYRYCYFLDVAAMAALAHRAAMRPLPAAPRDRPFFPRPRRLSP
jgi:hypothetical protein